MHIDWPNFTPWSALSGGGLIGLAAAWLLLFDGRILGASSIFAGVVRPVSGNVGWRLALLAGLVVTPALAGFLFKTHPPHFDVSWPALILGGLLVGLGTRLARGCTSGHGVCGLARLSPRSLVATLVFMALGFAMVFFTRHVLGSAG